MLMKTHIHSSDDLLVVSFVATILTIKTAPVGLAFRFVTEAKKEAVIHVFLGTLEKQMELFLTFKEKRVRSVTDAELPEKKANIAISSLVFRKFLPEPKNSDLNCTDSRSVINIAYTELPDGITMLVTHKDKSSRSFIISDYLVFKMLDCVERFFAIARTPYIGEDSILH